MNMAEKQLDFLTSGGTGKQLSMRLASSRGHSVERSNPGFKKTLFDLLDCHATLATTRLIIDLSLQFTPVINDDIA